MFIQRAGRGLEYWSLASQSELFDAWCAEQTKDITSYTLDAYCKKIWSHQCNGMVPAQSDRKFVGSIQIQRGV
ncbi:hypothetical protein DPMN_186229 [Dreissena polymorpha]|uniref:Uncharacterized protein n=1 Tax=Dreissena polymorpha TaxID=45954 RepID=A0A9D4I803_DREPO|nr:hypothetical protein DPMN_186229 [Dreissena polymorpha]